MTADFRPQRDTPLISEQTDDIPISEAFRRVRARWMFLLIMLVTGAVIGIVLAAGLRPVYVGEVLLAPTSKGGSGGLEGVAQRFSGLASIAGIQLGSGGGEADIAKATLSSFETLSEFISTRKLQGELLEAAVPRFAGLRLGSASDSQWVAVQVLKNHIEVLPEKGSTLVRLRIEWYEPEVAARWANEIASLADERLRRDALLAAEARLKYLQTRASEGGAVVVREAASRVMEDSLRTMAMAGADPEFAINVIDRAVPSERVMRPRKKLIVAGLGALGLMLGIIIAVVRPLGR